VNDSRSGWRKIKANGYSASIQQRMANGTARPTAGATLTHLTQKELRRDNHGRKEALWRSQQETVAASIT
jgi:hypothetical protein